MRVILYTGKGGVGKTTLSASTALRCAEQGHRTVVLSTDAAHSLADSFNVEIGREPVPLARNLIGLEVDVNHELRRNWGKIKDYITDFLASQGYEDLIAEELGIPPGVEELFSLMKLLEYHDSGEVDVVVVDCAPTGGTLRMLGLTDVLEWYMERFFHIERKIIKAIRPVAEKIVGAPLPRDDVYQSIENLYLRIRRTKELLIDPEQTSIRLVTNPEKMVIKESQRAYTYLSLFGFPVDAVVVNRIYPEEAKGGYIQKWKTIQRRHLKTIHDCFAPLPVFLGELFDDEMVGVDQLRAMAGCVFGPEDPARIFHSEKPIQVERNGHEYVLSIKMPYADRKDVDLWTRDDEIILTLGNVRRNIILPRALSTLSVKSAALVDGRFRIAFA